MKSFVPLLALTMLASGCASVSDHKNAVSATADQKMTLGTVQRQITVGMAQSEVVAALGSPNLVTRDRDGTETWVYDKFSTETAYSTSNAGISSLVIAGPAGALAGIGSSSGATSRSQRTLTVIIKFKNSLVSEFAYNSTAF